MALTKEKNKYTANSIFQGNELFRSERIEKLRNKILDEIPSICSERACLVTESYKKNEDESIVVKRAKVFNHLLKNMSIFIEEGELLVGNQGSRFKCVPIFPEFSINWLIKELDGDPIRPENRPNDKYIIDKEVEKKIREIANYWQGRTHEDRVLKSLPKDAKEAWDAGVINSGWLMFGGDGHITVDLRRVINEGIGAIKKEAKEKLKSLDFSEPLELKQRGFLQAVVICMDSIIKFSCRYSKLAEKLAKDESDSQRKKELLKISEICKRVPEFPATSFHEALQACWFINLVLQIENNGHSISWGRFDQNLYSFYKNDIKKNIIDKEHALELLECLWIKLAQLHKIWDWDGTKFFAGYQLWQNITISGQDKNGADVTNELSWLVLETQATIRLHTPSLSVRYHDRISDNFLNAAVEVIKLGGGQPAFYSDEVYIPALINRGISWDDASDYSIVGCVESIVEGKLGNRPNGAGFVNLTKILELALYNGKDPITGLWTLKGNGDLSTFKSYDDLYKAFKKQAEFYLKQQVITDAVIDFDTEVNIADPLVSSFVQNCVKRGKTVKEGGSLYDYCGPLYVGVANVGNSLAAIKKLVFDEKKLTGAQIKKALESNFEDTKNSPSASKIRKLLLEAPKYGNDDDYVDSIMVDYFRFVCEETAKYKTTRFGRGPIGCTWQPSTSSVSGNVAFGLNTGATPDGRFAFEPLADTASPFHGTDVKGPTASLKSVSKLPTILVSGGQLLNMKFTPESLEGDLNMKNFINLLRTFLGDLKGMHVQFNIVNAETLKCAQKTPENYKDLMVRVAGYSALFTSIDKALQDDIIARTENTFQ